MSTHYDDVVRSWKRIRDLIDYAIETRISELPETKVVDAAKYIAMGGKRLRGFLLVTIATHLGAHTRDALDAAVAVELVHAASLALDDIIDEDFMRRGVEAAWVKLGVKKAVMVSNLLIPFAQQIVYENYGIDALNRTVAAWLDISKGEVIDAFLPVDDLGEEIYLELIRLKTGALFRLAAELGVIVANRQDLIETASAFGEKLGMIYQIADDIRDSRNPEKIEKEPSLRLFLKWATPMDKAYEMINKMLDQTTYLLRELLDDYKSSVLLKLPRFIVDAMLNPEKIKINRTMLGV
jgi:geranylgeranyl pyrophosphate synthase